MASIGQDIEKAAAILRQGGLVAIPTETVYGLAGNALNEASILKIFKAKNRPAFDPLIAHVRDRQMVDQLVTHVSPLASRLMDAFWPGPLTILLEKKNHIPDLLTSGLDRVAIRMPRHPIALALLQQLDFPLAAPSANPFGYVSPTTAQHVADQLADKVDYILDGGAALVGIESTIIAINQDEIIVHRVGGLDLRELEKFAPVRQELNQSSNPVAPGMLKSHYAPRTPLIITDIAKWLSENSDVNAGIISFSQQFNGSIKQIALSPTGQLDEAASRLFAAIREMDKAGVSVIVTERFPNHGLGIAINDRLNRASAR